MKITLLLTILIILVSCQTNEKEKGAVAEDTVDLNSSKEVNAFIDREYLTNASEKDFPVTADPGDSIKNKEILAKNKSAEIVVKFLKWYKQNYSKINSIELVNNVHWDRDNDSTELYSVNFDSTEKYLGILHSSGFISDLYLNRWRKYFKEKEEDFKKSRQFEGPPNGFEFDFVLWTQDIDLSAIDSYKFIEVSESGIRSNVKIDISMVLDFSLSKHDHSWLIDDIENSR